MWMVSVEDIICSGHGQADILPGVHADRINKKEEYYVTTIISGFVWLQI